MSNQPTTGHTPTPWTCRGQQVIDTSEHAVSLAYCGMVAGAGICNDGKVRSFGVDQETANANAAFIVEAVNSHAALKARIQELEGALDFLFQTKWKSVEKDNMEFEGRVTCYQLDRARAALSHRSAKP